MARLDLNLRPAVASKALEWCRQRVEEGDTDEHRRHHDHPEVLLLGEDIARLKEELQKIQPFRRDLSSIVAVVAYVIKHLEEEVVAPLKDRADADVVSDLSSDVVEVEDQRRIATAAWLDSSDLRRGCDANANAMVGGETMKNKQEAPPGKECCCFTALALSTPAPLGQRPIVNVPRLAFEVQKQQQPCRHRRRKSRRCWSRELHRRFVDALDKLGGPQVATPRHIRELMKDHGLTNDEVKSHLQKYRLRVKKKKPSSAQVSGKHQPLPFSDHRSADSNEVGDLEIESDGWRSVQNQRLGEEFAV